MQKEIILLPQLNGEKKEPEGLWKRFLKVRRAISTINFSNSKNDINVTNWDGVDEGIHDFYGQIEAEINSIKLNLFVKGTQVDNQPRYEINPEGKLIYILRKETFVHIKGSFISADGQDGLIDMVLSNIDYGYEAYWLVYMKKHYQLEQVVDNKGNVIDVSNLHLDTNKYIIPNTNQTFQRMIKREKEK